MGALKSLQSLYLSGSPGLASLLDNIGALKSLNSLDLSGFSKLASLPDDIGTLKSLETLSLCGCLGLASLPDSIGRNSISLIASNWIRIHALKLWVMPVYEFNARQHRFIRERRPVNIECECQLIIKDRTKIDFSSYYYQEYEIMEWSNTIWKGEHVFIWSVHYLTFQMIEEICNRIKTVKFSIPALLSVRPQKEHSNLSNQVKTAKDSFLGPNILDTLQKLGNEYELLEKKYLQELSERKRPYNKVIVLKGNIRVFCRCRPLNQVEITNEAVFVQTKPIVASVLDGYNVCIFAYGQTGTGKTFTMEGSPENRGVNYRTLDELFGVSQERSSIMRYGLFVSMMEVYNEKIRDLLIDSSNQPPKNLLRVTVKGENLIDGQKTRSHLWMVVLAGSECVGKIDVEGERLKESQFINKSLSALGDVISALASKTGHIPFRNSKLTHMLQSSLGEY
ncbi:hypothetical protein NC651_012475 [Populus alba x Populus x berolinensis]|nr:hypothetical protein NC651_012475 [Populus alba x Populus x berolinensis]